MTSVSISDVNELIKRKENLESQITSLHEVLSTNGVGMKDALVDGEDYPLPNVDIRSVRHARHQIICLQNDHKQLMSEIEAGLHSIHNEHKPTPQTEAMDTDLKRLQDKPFARVDRVEADSPSHTAGMLVGDEITKFGSVTCENFQGLNNIATSVQHSKNSPMRIVVLRGGNTVTLSLTPQAWSGRGLLGCNIVTI